MQVVRKVLLLGVLGLTSIASCGGSRSTDGSTTGSTTPAQPVNNPGDGGELRAFLHLHLELNVSDEALPTTQITLVQTNETGSNERTDLGVFDGRCSDVTAEVRKTDDVFLAFHCQPYGEQRGVLVHLILRQGRLILLRAWLGSSKPEFDDFDQIRELPPFPSGIPVVTDYDEEEST